MKATKQSHDWHCHNHDTYGWRGEECKQCPVTPWEVEQLAFRNERLMTDYASVQEENNALRRIHAENLVIKDAEIARLKTVPMKYRRMEFNAQLQKENEDLRGQAFFDEGELSSLRQQLTTLQSKSAALADALEEIKLLAMTASLAVPNVAQIQNCATEALAAFNK